jgi:hypothetical protein
MNHGLSVTGPVLTPADREDLLISLLKEGRDNSQSSREIVAASGGQLKNGDIFRICKDLAKQGLIGSTVTDHKDSECRYYLVPNWQARREEFIKALVRRHNSQKPNKGDLAFLSMPRAEVDSILALLRSLAPISKMVDVGETADQTRARIAATRIEEQLGV